MNFTVEEKAILKQAMELLASKISAKGDEGKVLILPDDSHRLLKKVLSPTTVILSESVANTALSNEMTVQGAVQKLGEESGVVTATYHNIEPDAFVHFVEDASDPFVEHVLESLEDSSN